MTDSCSVYNSTLFANCLTGLSISELLKLQHSVKHITKQEEILENLYEKPTSRSECTEMENGQCDKPASMALMAEGRGYYPTSHASYDPWAAEKPTKLQTIFQISITALAFLSFGGYLLCLIVQSIKSKGTTFLHSAASTMAPTTGVRRIKVYRRSRRSSLPPLEATLGYNHYNYDHYNYKYDSGQAIYPY